MEYREEEYLQISGLQHFTFCPRQWALIHIEQLWKENLRTIEGDILHEKAHDSNFCESRNGRLIMRDLAVFSATLGISGNCDVVEFYSDKKGVSLFDHEGLYLPYPVEYKHGSPREDHANELQLCAQAMCLEEMLCCTIEEGALYFGETKRRQKIVLTNDLKEEVRMQLLKMHQLYDRQYTPKVRPSKSCNACSLKELCIPKILKNKSVSAYIKKCLENNR